MALRGNCKYERQVSKVAARSSWEGMDGSDRMKEQLRSFRRKEESSRPSVSEGREIGLISGIQKADLSTIEEFGTVKK
jgi:hypothetical protein